MHAFFMNILTIRNSDPEIVLRGRNLVKIDLGLMAVALTLSVIWLIQQDTIASAMALIIMIVCISSIWIARKGNISFAGFLVLGMLMLAVSLSMVLGGYLHDASFFMLIPIAITGAVLRPRQVWLTFFLAMLVLIPSVLFVIHTNPSVSTLERDFVWNASILLFLFSLISYLIASSTLHFRQQTKQALERADTLTLTLESSNAKLESQVAERTSALTQALEKQQAQAEDLQALLAQQQMLHETITMLSIPMIPVRHDVLIAPLIGVIDGQRAQQLVHTTLKQIEQMHAHVLILDITGVAMTDTALVQTLVQLAQAAQLLGAETRLVGVRPEVAQTLVNLTTDLHLLHSAATLQEALERVPSY